MRQLGQLSSCMRETSGLSSVEYVVLLALLVASTVPLWNELGAAITRKLRCAAESFDVELLDKCHEPSAVANGTRGAGDVIDASDL